MLKKRIIPCLDVRNGKVTKGINFLKNKDIADPVELAKFYSDNGADEIVFYDITASAEGRGIFTDILKEAASKVFIPLTVGGGVCTLDDFDIALNCGADKVSVNSGAVADPSLIRKAAERYGSQCVVISADVRRENGRYMVTARGGRDSTGLEAREWIHHCVSEGAGEVVINSMNADGVKGGFDIDMIKYVCEGLNVPVIASGGAGKPEDFTELFKKLPWVDAALAASVFHYKEIAIPDLKALLDKNGIPVRL